MDSQEAEIAEEMAAFDIHEADPGRVQRDATLGMLHGQV